MTHVKNEMINVCVKGFGWDALLATGKSGLFGVEDSKAGDL